MRAGGVAAALPATFPAAGPSVGYTVVKNGE
jgi:hypothetical protein